MVALRQALPRGSHEYSAWLEFGGVHTASRVQFGGSGAPLSIVQCTSAVQPCGGEWSVVVFQAQVQPR